MPSAPVISRYNPSFYRFPIQNARTGYQPVSLPLILIVPGRRIPPSSADLENSQILSAKYYITNAPNPAKVAGPFNTGLRVPNYSLFTLDITIPQLSQVYLNLVNYAFYNPNDPNKTLHPYDQAVSGVDFFNYTTRNGNITYGIPYYIDADYYDVSYFTLDVTDLPAPNSYDFVWEVTYYNRITVNPTQAPTIGPFCITDNIVLTRFTMNFQHPGNVHHEMVRKTPSLYFNQNVPLSQDQLVNFYRPLADVFQDVADEQGFLDGINFISDVPSQLLPYLAFLIGWDLPNFPGVTNTLRRAILRYAVYLQQLKGSSRAITELFNIFGYNIELLNLWYSTDGKQLIGPGEDDLPPEYKNQEIASNTVCQIDPLISNYATPSFGITGTSSPVDPETGLNTIPLVYRATSNISVIALLVQNGGSGSLSEQLSNLVMQLASNPDLLLNQCGTTPQGFLASNFIQSILSSNGGQILTYSEVLLDVNTGKAISFIGGGQPPPLINKSISYNPVVNSLNLTFDHFLSFDNSQLFMFALYQRTQNVVPIVLRNLRSNRFDIKVTTIGNNQINTDVIQYLMNFLYKLKAFHSLLRRIIFDITETEVYNVTDFCSQNFGNISQPPAVIVEEGSSGTCSLLVTNTQDATQNYQSTIYNALLAEQAAWAALDKTHEGGGTAYPEPARLNPIVGINTPIGSSCQFTKYGQDRVLYDKGFNPDTQPDTRPELCSMEGTVPPFCFKGRVQDPLTIERNLLFEEVSRFKPCELGMGIGEYWQIPTNCATLKMNGFGHFTGQDYGWLKGKIVDFDHPKPIALKFYNKAYLADDQFIPNTYLGYQRPSLDIQKDNNTFPGHRFPTMDKLVVDYTAASGSTFDTVCKLKPWDDAGANIPVQLVTGSDGNQYLVYPSLPYTLTGNGLTPDISSCSIHDDRPFQVTHKIYIEDVGGNPAVTLGINYPDQQSQLVQPPASQSITFDSSIPFAPMFSSYNPSCKKDYAAGYPAEGWYGRFNIIPSEVDYTRGSDDPISWSDNNPPPTELFYFGSEILLVKPTIGNKGSFDNGDVEWNFYKPYRFDCACTVYGCDVSGSSISPGSETDIKLNVNPCILSKYVQPDGTHDFSQDQLRLDISVQLKEPVGTCSYVLDGEIDNLLCTLPGPEKAQTGSVFYQDEYDVIYSTNWTWVNNTTLNIKQITKSPHVWGEPDTGYMEGLRVYRRGIVTTSETVLQYTGGVSPAGRDYKIVSQISSQDIEYILMNPPCNSPQYVDNFCYHVDCSVSDEFFAGVTCGPRWTNVSPQGSDIWYEGTDVSDVGCVWPELILDGFGNVIGFQSPPQAFQWVNVWGSNTIQTVCGASEA